MKRKTCCIVLLISFCFTKILYSQSQIDIQYRDSFTEITVQGERLTYYSKEPLPGSGNTIGFEQYVGGSQEKELSQGQIEKIKQWIDEYNVCDFVNPDFQGDSESYEAAFFHRLKVQCRDDTCDLEWTDASSWSESGEKQKIVRAVAEFKDISRQFLE